MNMISTGAFQTEMDASNKQPTLAEKFAAVWEKKNAKAARAGGVSLMALSLAACGSSDDTTTTSTADTTTTTTTTTDAAVSAALTKGVDTLTGGSGNDSFSGQAGDANATIIAGDTIDGAAGTDTFTLATNGTATSVAGLTLTGVENVRISDSATTSATVNLFGSTGVTDIESYASTGAALSVTNVGAVADLNLTNTSGTGTVSVTYTAAAVVGTADVQNIVLSGATGTGVVTIAGVETVNVVSASTGSTLAMATANATKLTVDADAATTINASNAANASMATVDMSASSGAVTLTAPAVATLAITGGSGADSMTINNISATTTVTGGDGADKVTTSQTALTQYDIANINAETLAFSAAPTSLSLTGNTNITTVDYTLGSGTSTLAGASDGMTVNLKAASTSLGVTMTSATGTADSLNVNVGTAGASGTTGIAAGTLTATGVETINIDSVGKAIVTGDTGVNTMTIAGSSVTSVDVDGDRDFTLTQAGATITSYDASEATGTQNTSNITFAAAGVTVKGGSDLDTLTGSAGADTVHGNGGVDTITTGAGADTIDGGAGNDSITGGTGADTMTGGAGSDVFTIADGDSLAGATAMDVITDFTAGADRLAMGQANTKFLGNYATLDEGLAGMTAANQSFFVTSNSQLYIVATQGTLAGTDDIVKLDGVTSLASSDLGTGALGAGAAITLTAAAAVVNATTKTNATAVSSNLDDTVTTTAANLAGSTIDTLLGSDTITVTTALTGTFDLDAVVSNADALVLATDGTTANDVDDVDIGTVTMGNNGDTVKINSDGKTLVVKGGTNVDDLTIEGANETGSIDMGTGTRDDIVRISGDTNAADVIALTMGAGTNDQLILSSATAHDITGFTLSGLETLAFDGTTSATITVAQAAALTNIDYGTTDNDTLIISGTAAELDLGGKLDNVTGTASDSCVLTAEGVTLLKLKGTEVDATTGGDLTINAAATATIEFTDAYAGVLTETAANNKIDLDGVGTVKFGDFTMKFEDGALGTFTAITGSGGTSTNATFGDDSAHDLSGETITNVTTLSFAAAASDAITIDGDTLVGTTTLIAHATSDFTITDTVDITNVTTTSGDFDSMIITDAKTVTATEKSLDADGTVTSMIAINSTAGVDANLVVNMSGTTFDLAGVTVGATQDVDTTITGTTGNDTITFWEASTAGSATVVNGNGGGDIFKLEDGSGNAAAVDSAATVTIADAIQIKDFDANNDTVMVDISDATGTNQSATSVATGAVNLNTTSGGFTLITGATMADFASKAGVISAVGANTTTDDDEMFVAIQNVAGTQVGIYNILFDGANAAATMAADDGVSLVALIDVTAGTFGLDNMSVY
jgi:Ca2+-binding RTX toxin-like protein